MVLTDAVQTFSQFIEAPWPLKKVAQDEQFPFTADQGNGRRNRAFGQFVFCFHHSAPSMSSSYAQLGAISIYLSNTAKSN